MLEQKIEKVMTNLRRNRMEAYYVPRLSEVLPLVESMLTDGNTVAVGGSVTLDEASVLNLLRNGNYRFLDRYAPDLTNEERVDVFRQSSAADVYLTSCNAITEQGELYNVDGRGNRVSAIAFGPEKVIVVVGVNKIVKDINEAIRRVKTVAAPLNAKRLHCDTYCCRVGHCQGLEGGMTDGCASPSRICCHYLISGMQREANRIKVILVGEACGY